MKFRCWLEKYKHIPFTEYKELVTEEQNNFIREYRCFLQNDAKQTVEQISVVLGKSKSTIEKAIRGLKEKGLIERIGSDKTGYWKVK